MQHGVAPKQPKMEPQPLKQPSYYVNIHAKHQLVTQTNHVRTPKTLTLPEGGPTAAGGFLARDLVEAAWV